MGNRTPDSAVRGLRLNLLTTRAYQGKKKYTISFIFRQVNLIHFFCVLKTDKKVQGIYSNYYKMLRKKEKNATSVLLKIYKLKSKPLQYANQWRLTEKGQTASL